jgi:hypothetical protein
VDFVDNPVEPVAKLATGFQKMRRGFAGKRAKKRAPGGAQTATAQTVYPVTLRS